MTTSIANLILLAVTTQSPLPVGPPPEYLSSADKRDAVLQTSYPGLTGSVDYDMRGRTLHISWYRDFGLDKPRQSHQPEPLGFWPTEVAYAGPNKLCIGGLNVKYQTMVWLFEFSTQETLDEPYVDEETGKTVYPETYIPTVNRSLIYRHSLTALNGGGPGKHMVRTMFRNRGANNRVFVQFDDSRDVYDLDLGTGALSLALAAATEPRLLNAYHDRFSADHTTYGYIYLLCTPSNASGLPESLVLVDPSRNGTLSSSATLNPVGDQWGTVFADQALFNDL